MDTMSTVIFVIAAFAAGGILILKRDSLPQSMRRGLAILSILLIAFSFFLIVYSLFNMGT